MAVVSVRSCLAQTPPAIQLVAGLFRHRGPPIAQRRWTAASHRPRVGHLISGFSWLHARLESGILGRTRWQDGVVGGVSFPITSPRARGT